jgi:alkylation response protein AidB-like acyl-CoA dehydrogenase
MKTDVGSDGPGAIDEIVARLVANAEELATLGAYYDAVAGYPTKSVQILVREGLHRIFACPASGGIAFVSDRAENTALLQVLRIIGRADLSLGRLFEGHVNALKLFAWYGNECQTREMAEILRQGNMFGVWATEPPPGVTLQRDGVRWRLNGRKSFATGAGSLAYAVVTAQPDSGPRRMVIVRADKPSRTDLSGWRVRGMRATTSGTYDLSGIEPTAPDFLGAAGDYDREPRFTAGAWRFAAVQLGGIEALLIETRAAMSASARNDPLQRLKFAKAVEATRTAYLWVREAASRAADELPDAKALVQMTRGVVERAGLDVMELAARIIGTRSAFEGQRIDKISRDLSLYLRQGGPDHARDQAALAWLYHDAWGDNDPLW